MFTLTSDLHISASQGFRIFGFQVAHIYYLFLNSIIFGFLRGFVEAIKLAQT